MPGSCSDRVAYVGRFAPSPTGPLHAGSLVAALASWLDARAHQGRWLVRIEDIDTPRCLPGADAHILQQLAACGLVSDAPPWRQCERSFAYQQALDHLLATGQAYACACTRQDIEQALAATGQTRGRHQELVYTGTCRPEHGGLRGRPARAVRLRCSAPGTTAAEAGADTDIHWHDRRLGPQSQQLCKAVGDFVLQRADGLWAYQLAVVVDDAAQGVTDVVRGEDLADNTPRQRRLQAALGMPTPRYLHTPLVRGADGDKLSKQHGAAPVPLDQPLAALEAAAQVLGLPPCDDTDIGRWLAQRVTAWAARWGAGRHAGRHSVA
jgi:glutamyl-Q tRNA(Asp) synthetase